MTLIELIEMIAIRGLHDGAAILRDSEGVEIIHFKLIDPYNNRSLSNFMNWFPLKFNDQDLKTLKTSQGVIFTKTQKGDRVLRTFTDKEEFFNAWSLLEPVYSI